MVSPAPKVLAELEIYHSRPIAPTRRVALGGVKVPVGDPPGFGGLLLGGIIGRYSAELDDDMLVDLHDLTIDVERGARIPQPRLRHRLQADRVGLLLSRHQLVRDDSGALRYVFDDTHHAPAQFVLAAVYAARFIEYEKRLHVMPVLRKAIGWTGAPDDQARLVAHLADENPAFALSVASHNDPVSWALEILKLDADLAGDRAGVQKQFRRLLRDAHPDTGENDVEEQAAQRIAELSEARRILLAS